MRLRELFIHWITQPQVVLGLIALVAVYLLTGCATVFDGPQPARDEVFARVRLVSDDALPPGVGGDALCDHGRCDIRIRRSSYPYCITHEVRHGFEPGFHAGRDSDESCYVGN